MRDIARRNRSELTRDQVLAMHRVQDAINVCCKEIDDNTPRSREHSVAITNLEQASMWAVKAITSEDNQ